MVICTWQYRPEPHPNSFAFVFNILGVRLCAYVRVRRDDLFLGDGCLHQKRVLSQTQQGF